LTLTRLSFLAKSPICTLALAAALNGATGVVLDVRLLTPLSSYSTKPGSTVIALVTGDVGREDRASVPPGSTVRGTVKRVHKVGLGFFHERARLDVEFHELELPGGHKCRLDAKLVAIENAREDVDRRGSIRGVRATDNLSHRAGYRLASLPTLSPMGYMPLFLVSTCLFRFPDPEIEYQAGTNMHLEVFQPLQLPHFESPRNTAVTVNKQDQEELESLVVAQPDTSFTKRQGEPMDLINLMFVGPQEVVERAFQAAGWTGARPISTGSGLRAVRAVVEARPYQEAPMRTLLVDGAEPDMTWQKTLNTFTKRDHLRIWRRPVELHGQPVWLSAATRDVGLGFSFRFGFVHETEEDIDREREDVVRDLHLTGCVAHVARVYRPEVARRYAQAQKREIQTDGAIAVVMLNSCENPQLGRPPAARPPRPGPTRRAVRQVVLSARNHYFRNNLVWELADLTRSGWRRMRRPEEKPEPAATPPENRREVVLRSTAVTAE
jgi:hypothetical protein